ncbi:hypothetical protein, partial [Nocardia sp. NPDC058497]|uniref:hypothetical protein n=1 Tax=Nocardia sp. NPDC058497 TaxID=3346529 RepID=UPI003661EA07
MVELLHFLLGSRGDKKSLFARKHLRGITFTLAMDWPGMDAPLEVSRSGAEPKNIRVRPNLAAPAYDLFPADMFAEDAGIITLEEWQRLIEDKLFGLPAVHPGVSGRMLLSFLLRQVGDPGFTEAVRSCSR